MQQYHEDIDLLFHVQHRQLPHTIYPQPDLVSESCDYVRVDFYVEDKRISYCKKVSLLKCFKRTNENHLSFRSVPKRRV
jgi:hypothetical protein